MPKIQYKHVQFKKSSLEIIAQAEAIINEYAGQGFSLTLRQLYYQFVARDLIPNKQTEYKRLGNVINEARLHGAIDWDSIVDRTRNLAAWRHEESPESALRRLAMNYGIDRWANQKVRPEVWIEKDALIGVIEGVCADLDVPYFSCRGYTSQSEMCRALCVAW